MGKYSTRLFRTGIAKQTSQQTRSIHTHTHTIAMWVHVTWRGEGSASLHAVPKPYCAHQKHHRKPPCWSLPPLLPSLLWPLLRLCPRACPSPPPTPLSPLQCSTTTASGPCPRDCTSLFLLCSVRLTSDDLLPALLCTRFCMPHPRESCSNCPLVFLHFALLLLRPRGPCRFDFSCWV